jgi:hypothetical protein
MELSRMKCIGSNSRRILPLLARSHGLYHTININFMPIYIELDKDQMLWMLSMMKKCFQAHNARLIVNKNLDHGNTQIIWDLICKAYMIAL